MRVVMNYSFTVWCTAPHSLLQHYSHSFSASSVFSFSLVILPLSPYPSPLPSPLSPPPPPSPSSHPRFSLALMLHQIEQTLQESFSQLGSPRQEVGMAGAGPEVDELRDTLAQLKQTLRQNQETHKIELQESKVGNLSWQAG